MVLRIVTDICQIIWQYYLPDNRLVVELENFNMANDSNNHLFRFTIPLSPLDSPVPQPGPYLFQSAGVQNHLPQYNLSQVHAISSSTIYIVCLTHLPLQAGRYKPHSLNKTPSLSQKYSESNHKRSHYKRFILCHF